jgi:hypothetical protein
LEPEAESRKDRWTPQQLQFRDRTMTSRQLDFGKCGIPLGMLSGRSRHSATKR